MNSRFGRCLALLVGGATLLSGAATPEGALPKVRAVKRLFASPPREYASGPLWVWNDQLTPEQIRSTLHDLADQDVKQAFVHPRPGLMTPYLGDDWFALWKVALREADRLDMNLWIYDENSYPSGFAGGHVPEAMPESRGLGLALKEASAPPAWDDDTVAVFRLAGDAAEDVSGASKAGTLAPAAGSFLVAKIVHADNSPWHGNRCYVNLLTPGVTEKFLDITLGAYDRHLGNEYGKRVPGVFTDEPNIRPAGGFPWCADLPVQFRQRRGYDLVPLLASLVRETGDWRRVRHDYYATLNELFIERWGQPYFEACEKRGLESTGHYWDHEWPHCVGVPDNMAMAAWQHRPGIDTLMNQYAENTHAQFGNVRFCREISSIANQLGRARTLVELYGAGGWDLRFEDMKRIADWLQVLGINTMDEHLSYVTLRGARKRDHPQSFSYHEPWWNAYHVHARYLSRLSAALSQGRQVNPILVLEPTTTAWMYQGNEPKLRELGDSFFRLLMALEAAQIEYDLGCEDVLGRHGSIGRNPAITPGWTSAATLHVGQRQYALVIVPEHTETVTRRTRSLLNDLLMAGGAVLNLGPAPERTDGHLDPDAMKEPTVERRWRSLPADQLVPALVELTKDVDVRIERAPGDAGILFHHRRELDDGQILFLVNTSREKPSRGVLTARVGGIERWDPYTGDVEVYPSRHSVPRVVADFDLPPSGSLLLFLSKSSIEPRDPPREDASPVASAGPLDIRRVAPNVLTLDYVDVTAGGETRNQVYFYDANRFVWQKHGVAQNPWDSAVQFNDELIRREFPADSGFTVAYGFTLEGAVPPNLEIVVERPDLFSIACNGTPVSARKGAWWLDRAFGRIPLARTARPGPNVVTLKASPMTMLHELEPAYLLGDFTLKPADHGWIVTPDQPLRLVRADATAASTGKRGAAGWNEQGHPFYSEGVTYRQRFDVPERTGRFVVSLPDWYGAVAKVVVNGKPAGWVSAPPWECDVTPVVKRGGNDVEITVIGTLKNTLGPHHGKPGLGSAWPGMFQKGANPQPPGTEYATVAYGLFEPPVLKRLVRQP